MSIQLNQISCINQLTGAAHTGLTVSQRNSSSKFPMYDRQPRIALRASYSGDSHPNHGMKFILSQPDDMVLGKMHQQIVLNWLRGQHKPTLIAEGWTVAAVRKVCEQKTYTSEELLEHMQQMNCFAHTMTLMSYFDEIVYAYAPAVDSTDTHETAVDKVARLCLEHDIRPGVRLRHALTAAPYSRRWDVIVRPDGEFEVAVKKKADEPEEKGITAVDYARDLIDRLEEEEDREARNRAHNQPRIEGPGAADERPVAPAAATPAHETPAGNPLGFVPGTVAHGTHTPIIDALRGGHVREFRGFDMAVPVQPGTGLTFAQLQQMRNEMMQVPPLTDPLAAMAREITAAQVRLQDEIIIERATEDPVQAATDMATFGTGVLLVPNVPTPPPPPAEPTTRFDPVAQ